MRIVIGIGGNALLQRGQAMTIANQRSSVLQACTAIAAVAREHEVIITHGNGPQVGLLALQAAAYPDVAPYPFDVLGAETQGMIGYLLAQALMNLLPHKKPMVLLTQVQVAADDPAFQQPTKFIGPVYSQEDSIALRKKYDWQFKQDGASFRRVVPSPLPQRILEIDTIRSLLSPEHIVICLGGGGIPVIQDPAGQYTGVEAVIDKDLSTALLATQLQADRLLLLTDVAKVMQNWGEPDASPIDQIALEEMQKQDFASGSMGPKVTAVCQFVRQTGKLAHIGLLSEAQQILECRAGTTILPP